MKRTLIALAALALLCGCRLGTRLFREPIPDLPTAQAQYEYATGLIERAEPLPVDTPAPHWRSTDAGNPYLDVPPLCYSDRDYRRFVRALEHVVERFPDDTLFTPVAKIRLGEFHYLLGDQGQAVDCYTDVLSSYPDEPILQAAALYGMGNVRIAQRNYTDARRYFNRLIQAHGNTELPEIQELLLKAQRRLFQLQHAIGR